MVEQGEIKDGLYPKDGFEWKRFFYEALNQRFRELQAKNSRFSVRALARKIDVAPGAISGFLAGKRTISKNKALSILKRLKVDESTLNRLRILAGETVTLSRTELGTDESDLITNWRCSAILCVLDFDEPPKTLNEIATRLGLEFEKSNEAARSLANRGFILIEESTGEVSRLKPDFTTTHDLPSTAIKARHRSDLEMSVQALEQFPVDQRLFTSLMLATSALGEEDLRREIKIFIDRVAALGSRAKRDRVVKLSVNLHPVSPRA